MKGLKNNKAITLIALVITIVVLIIVAAVAINVAVGENGIISRSKYAAELNEYQAAKEALEIKLKDIELRCMAENRKVEMADLLEELEKDDLEDFYIELYLYPQSSAVRRLAKDNKQTDKTPTAIVVSSSTTSSFKFCIDDEGAIQGVTKDEITPSTTVESFSTIEEYEFVEFGIKQTYTVTVAKGSGIQSVVGEGEYKAGDVVTLTRTMKSTSVASDYDIYEPASAETEPSLGDHRYKSTIQYAWQNWTGGPDGASTAETYTFVMPTHSVEIRANTTETSGRTAEQTYNETVEYYPALYAGDKYLTLGQTTTYSRNSGSYTYNYSLSYINGVVSVTCTSTNQPSDIYVSVHDGQLWISPYANMEPYQCISSVNPPTVAGQTDQSNVIVKSRGEAQWR